MTERNNNNAFFSILRGLIYRFLFCVRFNVIKRRFVYYITFINFLVMCLIKKAVCFQIKFTSYMNNE